MKKILILFIKLAPKWLVKFVVIRGVASLRKRHPDLMTRLSPTYGREIYAYFTDLKYGVLLNIGEENTQVKVGEKQNPNLSLKGKFFDLISIIEGKVDGDALFFSRKIEVEGDTETLIIIRNAFDSADICLIKEFLMIPNK